MKTQFAFIIVLRLRGIIAQGLHVHLERNGCLLGRLRVFGIVLQLRSNGQNLGLQRSLKLVALSSFARQVVRQLLDDLLLCLVLLLGAL